MISQLTKENLQDTENTFDAIQQLDWKQKDYEIHALLMVAVGNALWNERKHPENREILIETVNGLIADINELCNSSPETPPTLALIANILQQ